MRAFQQKNENGISENIWTIYSAYSDQEAETNESKCQVEPCDTIRGTAILPEHRLVLKESSYDTV